MGQVPGMEAAEGRARLLQAGKIRLAQDGQAGQPLAAIHQFLAQYQQLMGDGVPVVTATGTDPRTEYQAVFSDFDTSQFAEDASPTAHPSSSGGCCVASSPARTTITSCWTSR